MVKAAGVVSPTITSSNSSLAHPGQGHPATSAKNFSLNSNNLTMENSPSSSPNIYLHQLIEGLSHEILNSTTEWLANASAAGNTSTGIEDYDSFESGYVPYTDRLETYIVPVLFAIIFIIGVLGNGVLILIFLRHRTMRNVPNMYICSLAVGDILVIFFCVPFTSTVYTVESWPYGTLVCKFSEFIKDVSIGVSVFTLTALSADRYFAIVDPMRKLTGCRATRVTCITITGIWIVSILIALPSVLFSYIRFIDDDPSHTFNVCYPFPPELGDTYPKIIVMFKFLVYYAIPLIFIATFYIIMAHHLVRSTKDMPGEIHGQTKQIQARKKVAKMVLSFVVIFAICFFPSHVFLLWFYYNPNSRENFNAFWNFVRIIGFCLGFINSCINPITLYCLSGTFRKHFNKNLFCCISSRENRHGQRGGRNLLACGACVSMSNSAHVNGVAGHGASGSTDNRNRQLRGGYGCGVAGHQHNHGVYRTTTMTGTGGTQRKTWDSSLHHQHQHQQQPSSVLNQQRQILMTNLNNEVPLGPETIVIGDPTTPTHIGTTAAANGNHHHQHHYHSSHNTPLNSPKIVTKGIRDNFVVSSSPLLKSCSINSKSQSGRNSCANRKKSLQNDAIRQLSLEDLGIKTTSFIINTNPINGGTTTATTTTIEENRETNKFQTKDGEKLVFPNGSSGHEEIIETAA